MALEGSMSPNKGVSNNMLDCTSGKHSLNYERDIKDQDCRSLEQTIQELKMKLEYKDKRILELENEMHHIRIKLRENRENGDMKMLPNEATTTPSQENLMEASKDLKKVPSLAKDSEANQKHMKVCMCVCEIYIYIYCLLSIHLYIILIHILYPLPSGIFFHHPLQSLEIFRSNTVKFCWNGPVLISCLLNKLCRKHKFLYIILLKNWWAPMFL